MAQMAKSNGAAVEAVKDTIYRACLSLDEGKWADWLALCDENFAYSIKAFSPEIRRDMMYLDGDRAAIAKMCELLPKHNSDTSPLRRHATVYAVDVAEDGKSACAVTSVVIYRNLLDGTNSHIDAGGNQLFAIAKYHDRFRLADGAARFTEREVRLDTRRLDKGSHYPL